MDATQKRPGGNRGVRNSKAQQANLTLLPPPSHPWRRWATSAALDRLTARQALAVDLLQAGAVSTPEQPLRMLDRGDE